MLLAMDDLVVERVQLYLYLFFTPNSMDDVDDDILLIDSHFVWFFLVSCMMISIMMIMNVD